MNILQNFDSEILKFINDNFNSPIMDKIMVIVTSLGNGGLIWILISLALMIKPKYRRVGIMSICALILTTIIGEGILKNLVKEERPFISLPDIKLLITPPTSFSFPSGHTGSSFAVAGVLGSKIKKSRFYVFALAILIAFSRLYLYVHYPIDVIVGIILGLFCAKIVLYIFKRREKDNYNRNFKNLY
ncbi:phosphatase PAP2 family protein [Clostridium sp.]|uniref:phosphatase PAP2 family protein n=1 Tax=Clostridium sp. TaxID=1506 RepID=UPI002606AF5D|nr:phosphatase PAP2 family protein [Clostridium sp.]